jgi:hypothetical protein
MGCDFLPQFEHACLSSEKPQVRKKKKKKNGALFVQRTARASDVFRFYDVLRVVEGRLLACQCWGKCALTTSCTDERKACGMRAGVP